MPDEWARMGRTDRCRRTAAVPDYRLVEAGVVLMTANAWIQVIVYVGVLVALVQR